MTFADSPFVLLAHVHVKPDCVDQYLEIAATVDKAVEDSEPGMLLHTECARHTVEAPSDIACWVHPAITLLGDAFFDLPHHHLF